MASKRRLTVLSVIDGLSHGGDENRVLQLATAIDRERFDLRVATIRPQNPAIDRQFGTMSEEFKAAGISVIDLSVPRTTSGLGLNDLRRHALRAAMLVRTVRRLVHYLRRERIDVIDAHSPAGYLCGSLAGARTGVPSMMTTYNVREAWHPRVLWALVYALTLTSSHAVVTDSEPVADYVRSRMLPGRRGRVHVIPNGPQAPVPQRADAEVRAQLGLLPREQTRVIAQIAALLPGKGQHLLIDAAPQILARHPDVTVLIVGFEREQVGYGETLRARARRLGIADSVVVASYPGPIGDVWQLVDIHAHPTMLDSLPNAILEGMSLGRPLVASAVAGIPSLVVHRRTGLVIPENDANALADALVELLDDPGFANVLGEAARRRFEEGYTQELLARRMETLFAELASQ